MSTNTREFGSKAKDAAIAARVQREYTPEQWAASRQVTANHAAINAKAEAFKANQGTVDTLVELAASRTPWIDPTAIALFVATNSAEVVAQRIDWLQAQPVPRKAQPVKQMNSDGSMTYAPKADVPEGRYAVDGPDGTVRFYRVDRPTEGKWKGYTFVKVQASSELHPVKGKAAREAVLAAIAKAGIEEAMKRYGRELEHCGHCGRTLTNDNKPGPDGLTSLQRGIGPVCASKMGF